LAAFEKGDGFSRCNKGIRWGTKKNGEAERREKGKEK